MGRAIPYDNRVRIISRIRKGEKAKDLALEMGYSESGIKKIWYGYKKEGEAVYKNKYGNCGQRPYYGGQVKTV